MKVNRSLENRGGFLNVLRLLMTASLPLMKSVLTPLAKSVLLPLSLTAAVLATDAAIQKNFFWSGMTTLTFSEEELDNMAIVTSLKEAGLLINGVSETVKNKVK